MTLMDSPLNKANKLQVLLRTHNNILIKINPYCRIPRTYKRFAGLMVQLLHKLKIQAADSDSNTVLMKVVKNTLTKHVPTNAKRILCSQYAKETVYMGDFVRNFMSYPDKDTGKLPQQVVFVVGGFAHSEKTLEQLTADYGVDRSVCVSNYSLSASVVCSKIMNSYEELWQVL